MSTFLYTLGLNVASNVPVVGQAAGAAVILGTVLLAPVLIFALG
ncbi:hypothetical protein [Streptomyces sp. UNOC14_S4]|nr:hypothetical protein [Streptomyces sp. UNOC14_S4]